jgi:hypothetical protein
MTGISSGGFGGAKTPASVAGANPTLEQFTANRGSLDLSGMGLKQTVSEPYFGANSGNLYGYKGGNFLKTNKKL